MPRALEPGVKYPIVLDSDSDKPEDKQPKLFYRSLNGREWRRVAAVSDGIEQSPDSGTMLDSLYEVVCLGLIGWKNMADPATGKEIPFKPEDIDLVLDPHEASEVMQKILDAGKVSPSDKKKLESPA